MFNSTFLAHGNYQLSVEKNMVIVEAEGPWNNEFLTDLHNEFRKKIEQVDINNYAVLVIPIGEALAIGQAIYQHAEFVKQGNAKAIAIDLSNSTTPLSTETMFTKVYNEEEINHAFFTDRDTAIAWLAKQIE